MARLVSTLRQITCTVVVATKLAREGALVSLESVVACPAKPSVVANASILRPALCTVALVAKYAAAEVSAPADPAPALPDRNFAVESARRSRAIHQTVVDVELPV